MVHYAEHDVLPIVNSNSPPRLTAAPGFPRCDPQCCHSSRILTNAITLRSIAWILFATRILSPAQHRVSTPTFWAGQLGQMFAGVSVMRDSYAPIMTHLAP